MAGSFSGFLLEARKWTFGQVGHFDPHGDNVTRRYACDDVSSLTHEEGCTEKYQLNAQWFVKGRKRRKVAVVFV